MSHYVCLLRLAGCPSRQKLTAGAGSYKSDLAPRAFPAAVLMGEPSPGLVLAWRRRSYTWSPRMILLLAEPARIDFTDGDGRSFVLHPDGSFDYGHQGETCTTERWFVVVNSDCGQLATERAVHVALADRLYSRRLDSLLVERDGRGWAVIVTYLYTRTVGAAGDQVD